MGSKITQRGAAKPKYGVIFSLIGALEIIIFGNPALPENMPFVPPFEYVNLATTAGALSYLCGVSIIFFVLVITRGHRWSGIAIAILGALSIIVGLDRFYIGSILAVIGGIVGYLGR